MDPQPTGFHARPCPIKISAERLQVKVMAAVPGSLEKKAAGVGQSGTYGEQSKQKKQTYEKRYEYVYRERLKLI